MRLSLDEALSVPSHDLCCRFYGTGDTQSDRHSPEVANLWLGGRLTLRKVVETVACVWFQS